MIDTRRIDAFGRADHERQAGIRALVEHRVPRGLPVGLALAEVEGEIALTVLGPPCQSVKNVGSAASLLILVARSAHRHQVVALPAETCPDAKCGSRSCGKALCCRI